MAQHYSDTEGNDFLRLIVFLMLIVPPKKPQVNPIHLIWGEQLHSLHAKEGLVSVW